MPVQSSSDGVTVEDVRDRVGEQSDDATTARLEQCLELARVKVAAHTADYDADVALYPTLPPIPAVVRDAAILAVAEEIWNQQNAPNGVLNQQIDTVDGVTSVPVRISADPLRPAYPLLGSWVSPVTFA